MLIILLGFLYIKLAKYRLEITSYYLIVKAARVIIDAKKYVRSVFIVRHTDCVGHKNF